MIILDVSGGYSAPFGSYSSMDKKNDFSGYATGGFFIQAAGTIKGKGLIGLGFSYLYQQNPLNKKADTITPEGHQYQLGTTPWRNHYVLIGPSLYQRINKWFVQAKVLGGLILASSSNFSMTIPPVDSLASPTLSSGMGLGFALQVMVGGGYRFSQHWGIMANVHFIGGNTQRKKDYFTHSYVFDPELQEWVLLVQGGEFKIKKKPSAIEIGIGIVYIL